MALQGEGPVSFVVVVVVVVDIDDATPVYWGLLYSSGLCVFNYLYVPTNQTADCNTFNCIRY